MECFKKRIRKRIVGCILLLIVITLMQVLSLLNIITPIETIEHWKDFWQGYLVGITAAAQVISIVIIIRCILTLKNQEKLKCMYIRENDERELAIAAKSGMSSYYFDVGGVLLATIIGGYFNWIVSLTCLVISLYISIVRVALSFYYRKQM